MYLASMPSLVRTSSTLSFVCKIEPASHCARSFIPLFPLCRSPANADVHMLVSWDQFFQSCLGFQIRFHVILRISTFGSVLRARRYLAQDPCELILKTIFEHQPRFLNLRQSLFWIQCSSRARCSRVKSDCSYFLL